MFVLGLVSSWREGRLIRGAVDSALEACDSVLVYEGPIGEPPLVGHASDLEPYRKDQRVIVRHGYWDSDGQKRQAMLEASRRYPTPTWGVLVDGDEVLVNARYLPDWLATAPGDAVNMSLPIVEMDGSVGRTETHVYRLDLLERFLLSASQVQVRGSSAVLTFANYPAEAQDIVDRWRVMVESGQQITMPPLPCQPFILHRSPLRPADRRDVRLHAAEPEWFAQAERDAGLSGIILP